MVHDHRANPYDVPGGGAIQRPVRPMSLWRILAKCLGGALLFAAVGLWAVPAENSAVMLLKLGASIAFLGGSLTCFLAARSARVITHLQLDARNDELRVLEQDDAGRLFLQERHNLAHIGDVQVKDDRFYAWDHSGELLVDVPVGPETGRRALQDVADSHGDFGRYSDSIGAHQPTG